jgi:hypothetical protein
MPEDEVDLMSKVGNSGRYVGHIAASSDELSNGEAFEVHLLSLIVRAWRVGVVINVLNLEWRQWRGEGVAKVPKERLQPHIFTG